MILGLLQKIRLRQTLFLGEKTRFVGSNEAYLSCETSFSPSVGSADSQLLPRI